MIFQKIAVVGSGVMGAGIAAHIANAGVQVLLFDIVPKDAISNNILAATALEKLTTTDALMHPDNIKLITACNLTTDLAKFADVDWVIEVIIENLALKLALYQQISPYLKPDAIISSNTSTIPLAKLVANSPQSFKKNFLITHFFNPPRYMQLLELISGVDTLPSVVEKVSQFCQIQLGKGVIKCHDSPGFIANRLGCFFLELGLTQALKFELSISVIDALLSTTLGIPKTGVFGLMDLIGIDVMELIAKSLVDTLKDADYFKHIYFKHEVIQHMLSKNLLGRKAKSGFYRLQMPDKKKQELNLSTLAYQEISSLKETITLKQIITSNSHEANYVTSVIWQLLYYATTLVPEVCDNVYEIDEAMKLGFNWQYGPFELIDLVGRDFLCKMIEQNQLAIPEILQNPQTFYQEKAGVKYFIKNNHYLQIPSNELKLATVKKQPRLFHNNSVALWDLGDKVACLVLIGKMPVLNLEVFKGIKHALSDKSFDAMIITAEQENFCAGGDLKYLLALIEAENYPGIDEFIAMGQEVMKLIKYASIPVIAAVSGYAVGGGCELLLHCHKIQAHAESYLGLVETSIGLIPAWGGCKELRSRYAGENLQQAHSLLMQSKISKSAFLAREMLHLEDKMLISMNKDLLLSEAKKLAQNSLAKNYSPPPKPDFSKETFQIEQLYANDDSSIAKYLVEILSHAASEDELFSLEKKYFVNLCKFLLTKEKIKNKISS
jgi:3-hydroxyacyl-CoA dehydrogenase